MKAVSTRPRPSRRTIGAGGLHALVMWPTHRTISEGVLGLVTKPPIKAPTPVAPRKTTQLGPIRGSHYSSPRRNSSTQMAPRPIPTAAPISAPSFHCRGRYRAESGSPVKRSGSGLKLTKRLGATGPCAVAALGATKSAGPRRLRSLGRIMPSKKNKRDRRPHNVCFCCGRSYRKGWAGRSHPTVVITNAPPNPSLHAAITSKRRYRAVTRGAHGPAAQIGPWPQSWAAFGLRCATCHRTPAGSTTYATRSPHGCIAGALGGVTPKRPGRSTDWMCCHH